MGDSDDKNRVTEEVDDRLDAFFSEDDWTEKGPPPESPVKAAKEEPDDFIAEEQWAEGGAAPVGADVAQNLGISELKASILSLDWEITDETMEILSREVERLQDAWKGDNILISFLSLLRSLAKYIKRRKATALPESISLLRSVYDNLERVLSTKGMDRESKKQIVLSEVAKFEKFKKHILQSAKAAPKKAAPEARPETPRTAPAAQAAPAVMAEGDMQEMKAAMAQLVQSVREISETLSAIRRMMEENLPQARK